MARTLRLDSAERHHFYRLADHGPRVKAYRHVRLGELRFSTTGLMAAPELRMIVYTPLDDATRSAVSVLMGKGAIES